MCHCLTAGYFELLPHDPNGKYNGPLELSCNLQPVINQLARKATLLDSTHGDLTFIRLTNSTVAIYTLPPAYGYDRVPTMSIALSGNTFEEACLRSRTTGGLYDMIHVIQKRQITEESV